MILSFICDFNVFISKPDFISQMIASFGGMDSPSKFLNIIGVLNVLSIFVLSIIFLSLLFLIKVIKSFIPFLKVILPFCRFNCSWIIPVQSNSNLQYFTSQLSIPSKSIFIILFIFFGLSNCKSSFKSFFNIFTSNSYFSFKLESLILPNSSIFFSNLSLLSIIILYSFFFSYWNSFSFSFSIFLSYVLFDRSFSFPFFLFFSFLLFNLSLSFPFFLSFISSDGFLSFSFALPLVSSAVFTSSFSISFITFFSSSFFGFSAFLSFLSSFWANIYFVTLFCSNLKMRRLLYLLI